MKDTEVQLKSIADIARENVVFYIDAYQRGYRWTINEVRDLLDDIREFGRQKKPDDGTFYCLQPIILTKNYDKSWKVIDGQQRLTTLYLIYSFYQVISNVFMREPMPFELHYNGKARLEECLSKFVSKNYATSQAVEQEMTEFENDIDCYYVIEAYKCICDYFHKLSKDMSTRNEINDMKKIFDSYMKVIWYEIVDCDINTEVEVFSKINMGKIQLTNAELIKALLLKKDSVDSEDLIPIQTNIAVKWDEIEAQLSEQSFWSFLVNDDDYSYLTRIDFIFRVMARELNNGVLKRATEEHPEEEPYVVSEGSNEEKFSFYVLSNYVRFLQKHPNPDSKENYISSIWNKVCEYYRMFKDWYHNVHWYHMIGFIVARSKSNNIDKILELSQLYKGSEDHVTHGHKQYFETELRKKITSVVFGKADVNTKECLDFISDLNYEDNKDDIRNVLLLYNVAWLEACKENGRFPFDKYKDTHISWDIEHINAVADSMPNDDRRDSEDNARLLWLKRSLAIPEIDQIETVDGRNVQALINEIIDGKLYLSKNQPTSRDFILVYETIINHFGGANGPDNSIANLTLLDGGTNRAYKNDVFPLKRKTILERSMKDVFIPLCTKKVFMKGFSESTDLLRWHDVDKGAYTKEIISCVSKYLKLEVVE